ncbi:DNRLRE domain-containing protein [Nonomuraea sp. NPDC059194]|uniref:DNRLRE domain-containing protein n=1 Tax=Nonomuraea sp. NPDC059194 TaxID=3346764 RepID=UPI00367C1960
MPIDTSVFQQGDVLRPKALSSAISVTVANGGAGPFATMTTRDGQSYALRWPTPLPTPTANGNKITFADAAGRGADLVVTVLATGFRHDVVVRERPAKPLEIRIGVETSGLTLSKAKDGRLVLKNKAGKEVASAPEPVMWDAAAGTGSKPGRGKHGSISTKVEKADGGQVLVLRPDPKFVADSSTKLPITVDPTTTLTVLSDAWISDYGTEGSGTYHNDELWAGMWDAEEAQPYVERAFLKFDTAALAGVNVSAATLNMRRIDAVGCGDALSGVKVQRVTAAWADTQLTWANQPATTTDGEAVAHDYTTCAAPGPVDWNLTAMTQAWASGTANHGIMLRGVDEAVTGGRPYYDRAFGSSDHATTKPSLSVTYTLDSNPTAGQLQISPATSGGGTVTATSLTPQLAATVTDTVGGTLTGEFEIEHDPVATGQGSGQIWTGASPAATSGSQASVTVPAGKLVDGWKIRWRARAVNTGTSAVSAWSAWQLATVDVPNPTVAGLQVTPSTQVDGVTVTTSLTPSLHTAVTDPGGQPVRAEFEVEHDPAATGQGTGQVWAGGVDNVASGNQATVTIPTGKLTDGWKIRWRARAVNPTTSASSPWSQWQSVTVDISDPVSEPAVAALQVNPSQVIDGKVHTASLTPSLLAQVTDPVGGTLRAEFEVEHDPAATGQGTGQIWAGGVDNVASGNQATVTIPTGKLTDGWKIRWRARAMSPTAASAWSDWQSLTVSVPKPTISDLKIDPAAVSDGTTLVTSLTPTVKATLTHPAGLPMRAEFEVEHDPAATGQGTGQIWAGGVDNVASGSQASLTIPTGTLTDGWKIRWRARAVGADSASPWSTWQDGTVRLTQPGQEPLAQTNGPVIRTDQSFTAAAWLRWSDKEGDYNVVEQRGAHQAPFRLGNTPDRGLVFTLTDGDAADATVEGVVSNVESPVGEWFHLAGAYDATTKTASLYLNGVLVKSVPVSLTPWNADAAMTLGSRIQGDLDEVQIYQRVLDAGEIAELLTAPVSQSSRVDSPSASPAQSTSSSAEPPASKFKYEHPSLEDCEVTSRLTGPISRRLERPYAMCWSAWIGYTGWEEEDVDGVKRRKPADWTKILPHPLLKLGAKLVNQLHPGDVFAFRATWVAHGYLGDRTGRAIQDGGAGSAGLTPQDMKFWLKLSEFGIYNTGVRRASLDDEMDEAVIRFGLDTTPGCGVDGGPVDQLKTVAQWRGTYLEHLIRAQKQAANHDREVCSILPAITGHEDKRGRLRLWDQEILNPLGKRLGVIQWGQGIPQNDEIGAPTFRCDWRHAGPIDDPRIGGCVNIRADRVFTMSKSKDHNFRFVIEHIEKALDKNRNADTNPPYRPGDTTKGRENVEFPPLREKTGTELPKVIPGNYAAALGSAEGEPLWRASVRGHDENREVFSRHKVTANGIGEDGVPYQFSLGNSWGSNYCKYYDEKLYLQHGNGALRCDEYPFASTEQGAAKDKINYSVKAVFTSHNDRHGTALSIFYGAYRVIKYDPEKTPVKVSDNPFWVRIVD